MRRIALRISALAVLAGCSGCGWGTTDIESLVREPHRYHARPLTVAGRVVWSGYLPEVGIRGIVLQDGEARLLVLSRRMEPPIGEKIKVAGHFEASFDLGDRYEPVLIDEDPGPKRNGGATDVR